MRKKAQLNDMIFVIVTLTSIALTMLIAGFIYYEIQPAMTDPEFAPNVSIDAYNAFSVAFPMFDMSLTVITVALIIGLLVSAMFIPTSVIFIVINIVGIVPLLFLGAVFSNVYGAILEENGTYTTMALIAQNNYPITTFVISNLPYIGIGLIILVSLVMYAKRNTQYG